MKFKSKINPINITAHILIIIACLALTFWAYYSLLQTEKSFLEMILPILVAFVAIMIMINAAMPLFKTRYTLKDDHLEIIWGRNESRILYKNLMIIEKSKKWLTFNCLSIDKLMITYLDGGERKTIHISPKNQEEFIQELRMRAKSMKVVK